MPGKHNAGGCGCCGPGDGWCGICTGNTSPDQIQLVITGWGDENCDCCETYNDTFLLDRTSTTCVWIETFEACAIRYERFNWSDPAPPAYHLNWRCDSGAVSTLRFALSRAVRDGVHVIVATLTITMTEHMRFPDGTQFNVTHVYTYEHVWEVDSATDTIDCGTELNQLTLEFVSYATFGTSPYSSTPCNHAYGSGGVTIYPVYL